MIGCSRAGEAPKNPGGRCICIMCYSTLYEAPITRRSEAATPSTLVLRSERSPDEVKGLEVEAHHGRDDA
jgi:hypothetical protein